MHTSYEYTLEQRMAAGTDHPVDADDKYEGQASRATATHAVVALWRQAVQGNATARHALLRRIMSPGTYPQPGAVLEGRALPSRGKRQRRAA
jgi:hypothetical protein